MTDDELCPNNVEELCDLVKSAGASNSSLLIKGTGSKQGWGHPDGNGQRVSVRSLSGITLYEPEELVMTADSGTSIRYIKNLLDENKQHLAFEPPDLNRLYLSLIHI